MLLFQRALIGKTRNGNARRVYLLALLLLCNALTPLTASAGNNSSKVLLCTSSGYQWVEVANESSTTLADKQGSHCVLCITSDDESDFLLPNLSSPYVIRHSHAGLNWFAKQFSLPANYNQLQPRAPPTIL